jgi:amino-acid N-acetyltransferase
MKEFQLLLLLDICSVYNLAMMIRNATIQDVKRIHELINSYAEMDRMLFASMSNIYENLQIFKVCELDGEVVGCCALKVLWKDLAEIKSLAVDEAQFGKGIGRALVLGCIEKAKKLGLKKVFILTLEPDFFAKLGFVPVQKESLPMKVWSDCAECPKQDHCDEIALECVL